MPVYVAAGDPTWTFDPIEMERQVATFAKAQAPAITTQTQWTAFINALGSPGSIEVTKGLLRAIKCSVP
jgi:hypothetical protein